MPDQDTNGDIAALVEASNAEQVEKARNQPPPESTFDLAGDAIIQLDTAGRIVEIVWSVSGVVAEGIGTVGKVASDIVEMIPTLD